MDFEVFACTFAVHDKSFADQPGIGIGVVMMKVLGMVTCSADSGHGST